MKRRHSTLCACVRAYLHTCLKFFLNRRMICSDFIIQIDFDIEQRIVEAANEAYLKQSNRFVPKGFAFLAQIFRCCCCCFANMYSVLYSSFWSKHGFDKANVNKLNQSACCIKKSDIDRMWLLAGQNRKIDMATTER